MMTDWNDKRVLILGAARQGIALARWLAHHGSRVTLSDSRQMDDLTSARAALVDINVKWIVGGHQLELLETTDVICPFGGVLLTLPIVQEALKRGIPLSNDTEIFMEVAPCKTIGITGSAGKTTTTTLVGNMAKIAVGEHAYIGGNIGDPLINYVDNMHTDDLAVLEISSFQLDQMNISPNISAILNITPNHLDRHGTMEAYINAKSRILDFQTGKDIAVLSRDDNGAWNLRDRVKGKLYTFSLHELDAGLNGAYLYNGSLNLRDENVNAPLLRRDDIHLRGDQNVSNVLAAFTIGHAAGFKADDMLKAVREFRGVPHRLELVRELHGVRWYNDSTATTPERSMAAIHAFDEPIVLMLGGRDKDLPWEDLMRLVSQRVDHLVLFGEAAEKIQKTGNSLRLSEKRFTVTCAAGLHEAVLKAAEVAESGDVVLLSPGGTSFDEFKDFAERGERFKLWLQEL